MEPNGTPQARVHLHVHPTSGYLGVKTIVQVKERFTEKGVVEDVKKIVSTFTSGIHQYFVYNIDMLHVICACINSAYHGNI